MARTYWYGYDRTGQPSGPYFETRVEAADALGEDELLRPVAEESLPDGAEIEGESTDAEYRAVESFDDPQAAIDAGECYWCDEYSGENVGQHASSAHPDAWDAFKSDE